MSDIIRLARQLNEHINQLQLLSAEYGDLANKAVNARNRYDISKSRALLTIRTDDTMSRWTVPVQAAQVTKMVESEMIEARVSEAMLDACKTKLYAMQASLGAVQSLGKLLQTESSLDNYRT